MSQFSESEIELMQMEMARQGHPDHRLKLEALILFAKTANKPMVAKELNITEEQLSRWVHVYVEEGLSDLLSSSAPQPSTSDFLFFEQSENYEFLFSQLQKLANSLPPQSLDTGLGLWLQNLQNHTKKMHDTFEKIKENKD